MYCFRFSLPRADVVVVSTEFSSRGGPFDGRSLLAIALDDEERRRLSSLMSLPPPRSNVPMTSPRRRLRERRGRRADSIATPRDEGCECGERGENARAALLPRRSALLIIDIRDHCEDRAKNAMCVILDRMDIILAAGRTGAFPGSIMVRTSDTASKCIVSPLHFFRLYDGQTTLNVVSDL